MKGSADPGRARGSQRQSTGQEGSASDGGPRFNRDVKCDKDASDRPAECSGYPSAPLSAAVTPSSAFLCIHAVSLVALTYFIYLFFIQCCGSVGCVKALCARPHSWRGPFQSSRQCQKRHRNTKKKKRCLSMVFPYESEARDIITLL